MEPQAVVFNIIILVLLLVLSAFFSGSETALTTVSRVRIETIAREAEGTYRGRRALRVLKATDDKSKMLSAILIGNNLVNIASTAIATSFAIRLVGDVGVGVTTGVLTLLVLIFGEITPKTMSASRATSMSLSVAGVILALMWILTPVIFVLNKFVNGMLYVFRVRTGEEDSGMTSQELITAVNISHEEGKLEEDEKDYIENIFDFSESTAKEVMTPRIDVTAVSMDWSFEKILDVFSENMYTRYPVYEKDPEKICGIINVKDLLLYDRKNPFNVKDFVREAYFTYELKNTSELFEEMRQNSISMAIVLDEYGALAGILSLEDLLEELVGEIRDEFDDDEVDDITPLSEREYAVEGGANLEDLCDDLPLGFVSEDYDTIGGYLTGLFDHFPKAGETYVTSDGITLRVVEVSQNRIEKIRIRFPVPVEEFVKSQGEDE